MMEEDIASSINPHRNDTALPPMLLLELRPARARDQFGRRGSRFRGQNAVEDVSCISTVLCPVGSIDLVVDVVVGVDECDVMLKTACSYPTLVLLPGTPEPMATPPPYGSNVQLVAVTDGPHGDRFFVACRRAGVMRSAPLPQLRSGRAHHFSKQSLLRHLRTIAGDCPPRVLEKSRSFPQIFGIGSLS